MMDRSEEALNGAGWIPDRCVDVKPALAALEREGYSVWPELGEFLKEFTDLVVVFERNGRQDSLWIDPVRACRWADRSAVADYESRLETNLAPVGYAYHDHLLLLAAIGGKFIGTYDGFVSMLGTSPKEMVNTLVAGEATSLS